MYLDFMEQGNDWFDGFRAGEEQSIRHAFDKYYRPVTYYALKILNDETCAEDIVSEAFRKAWDARRTLETPKNLENYLYLVTRNACVSHWRKRKTARTTDKDWTHLFSDAEIDSPLDREHAQSRLIKVILEQLESLPGGDIVRMSFLEGKSTEEIAEKLQISKNNVYIQKSRALDTLRKILSKTDWALLMLLFVHCSRFPAMDMQHDALSSSKKHVASSPGLYPEHLYPGQTAYR
jgi:RNA polymerase sigma factor (sigma-70 family)